MDSSISYFPNSKHSPKHCIRSITNTSILISKMRMICMGKKAIWSSCLLSSCLHRLMNLSFFTSFRYQGKPSTPNSLFLCTESFRCTDNFTAVTEGLHLCTQIDEQLSSKSNFDVRDCVSSHCKL